MLGRLLGRTQKNDDETENPGAELPPGVKSEQRERTGKVNLEDVNKRIQAGSEAIIELNKHYQSLTISDPDQQEIKTLISDIKVKFEQLAVLSEKQSAFNLVEEKMYELLALATSSLKMLTKRKKGLFFKRTNDEYKNPNMKHYIKLRAKLAEIHALQLKHAEAVFKNELYELVKTELAPLDPKNVFIKFNSNGVVEQLPENFKGGGYTRKRSKSQSRKNRKQRGRHGKGNHSRHNRRQRNRQYTRKRI